MKESSTVQLNNCFASCEGIDDLLELMDKSRNLYTEWSEYIKNILDCSGLSYQRFGDRCGVSKTSVMKWCNQGSLPQNRRTFVLIGLAVNMNVDEVNFLLQRYGKLPKLYAKNVEDAIYLYVISHRDCCGEFESVSDYVQYLHERFVSAVISRYSNDSRNAVGEESTEGLQKKIFNLRDDRDFEDFVTANIDVFLSATTKLIEYIDSYIMASISASDPQCKKPSLHGFIEQKNLNACFEHIILKMRNRRIIPQRERLIALGVHMNMTLDEINTMLDLAYMEHLCAKDKVECVIIYAIESAYLENPIFELENAMLLRQYTNDSALRERCDGIIAEHYQHQLRYSESEEDASTEVSDYVRRVFSSLDMDETRQLLGI